jgi:hypothetical protein
MQHVTSQLIGASYITAKYYGQKLSYYQNSAEWISPTVCVRKDYETEEEARAQKMDVEPLINKMKW